MSARAKKRAAQVGRRPSVRHWIERFQKLAEEMPPEVWVFVANAGPSVMAYDSKGKRFMGPNHGTDRDGVVDSVHGGKWEGGDW